MLTHQPLPYARLSLFVPPAAPPSRCSIQYSLNAGEVSENITPTFLIVRTRGSLFRMFPSAFPGIQHHHITMQESGTRIFI